MGNSLVDRIWAAVFERVGEDLRVVTRYDANTYDTRMRADVRTAYSTKEDQAIIDDTIIKQLSLPDTTDAFKTGELEGLVRIFEDAWVLTWTPELPAKSGVLISIERDGEAATINDVEWCVTFLDRNIAPDLE